jgi:hypothetical protein
MALSITLVASGHRANITNIYAEITRNNFHIEFWCCIQNAEFISDLLFNLIYFLLSISITHIIKPLKQNQFHVFFGKRKK